MTEPTTPNTSVDQPPAVRWDNREREAFANLCGALDVDVDEPLAMVLNEATGTIAWYREQNRMLRDAVEGRWFPDDLSEDGEPTLPRGWAIIDAGRLDELEDLEERHRDNLRAVAAFEGAVRELETSNAELRRRIQQATQTLLRPPGDPESTRRLVLDQLGYGLLGRIDKEM